MDLTDVPNMLKALLFIFRIQETIGLPLSTTSCTTNEFFCTVDNSCIPESWHCDGDRDCSNGQDEKRCEDRATIPPCSFNEFQCDSGACIPIRHLCDGDEDCPDGDDEGECGEDSVAAPICDASFFQCMDLQTCIPIRWECDGEPDCADQSDEENCDISGFIFTCKDSTRLDISVRCNAIQDCAKGEDEERCTTCPGFHCSSGKCILESQQCDGQNDCGDGEDEPLSCNGACSENNGNCEQVCITVKKKAVCDCNHGYRLFNKTHCEDEDECATDGECQHPFVCTNLLGSYECSCPPKYHRTASDDSCWLVEMINPALIFTNQKQVVWYNTLDRYEMGLISGFRNIVGLDFDPSSAEVFFSKVGTKDEKGKLYKFFPVSHQEPQLITDEGVQLADGLAFDWIYNNLYFTESQENKIEVICMSSLSRHILFSEDLDEPRGLAIDPRHGFLYFTDWGTIPKIEKAAMDGSERRIIIEKHLKWPNGLCIDYELGRLFWTNADTHSTGGYIGSSDLEGGNIRILVEGMARVNHPFGITVLQDTIYWSDWDYMKVYSANSFTGSNQQMVMENILVMDMKVFNKRAKYEAPNYCPTGQSACSHICTASPSEDHYACLCPYNMVLGKDGNTCICVDGFKVLGTNGSGCGFPDLTTMVPTMDDGNLFTAIEISTDKISSEVELLEPTQSSPSQFPSNTAMNITEIELHLRCKVIGSRVLCNRQNWSGNELFNEGVNGSRRILWCQLDDENP